jgi:Ran GTPase-activating protein (RanGAP) involved in mRNA processing and transport
MRNYKGIFKVLDVFDIVQESDEEENEDSSAELEEQNVENSSSAVAELDREMELFISRGAD